MSSGNFGSYSDHGRPGTYLDRFYKLSKNNRLSLLDHVRDQTHKPGALDSCRQITLMLGAQTELLGRINLPLRVEKSTQKIRVLVIDIFQLATKYAALDVHNNKMIIISKNDTLSLF